MTKLAAQSRVITLAGATLGASAVPAYAYLDPGTGSMLLQLLLGGIAGAAVVIKLYWLKFLSLFGTRSRTCEPDADQERSGAKADA